MRKIILLLASVCAATAMNAQSLLTVPNDARSLGMADATFATIDNAYNAITNPAGFVIGSKTFSAGLGYTYFQPGKAGGHTHIPSLAAAYKINDRWSVSLNAGSFLLKPYDIISDKGQMDPNGKFHPYQIYLSAGVGFRIVDNFSVGANIRYFNSALSSTAALAGYKDANAVSADISLMYSNSGVSIALGVSDLGSKLKYGESPVTPRFMPLATKLGIAYDLKINQNNQLTFAVQSNWYARISGFTVGAAVEYTLFDNLFVRGGYRYAADGKQVIPSYGSVGIGGKIKGFALSGAYLISQKDSPLFNTFSLTLSYEF